MPVGTEEAYNESRSALERVQNFDIDSLPRENDLGTQLNFKNAIPPAQALIDLYRRLSLQALEDFPDNILTTIRDHANSTYNLFDQINKFDVAQNNPQQIRQSIIDQLKNTYPNTFQALHPYISYSLHRSADFQRLDTQARATLQAVEDKANEFSERMSSQETEANRILGEIRKVAAEEGVTQQAAHFRAESDLHDSKAEEWRKKTVQIAILLGIFAIASMFIHKIPFLRPETIYDNIQLSISKILIFGVITYMLFLSARNFLSHRHNAIVNKHRQNALMTHRALVDGSTDGGARDAIMVQAASCIFAPQPTGYTQSSDNDVSTPRSVVEILSKQISPNS